MKENRYFAIDVTKMILAILVVALHSLPLSDNQDFNDAVRFICELAVPLFFCFSGFFFRTKTTLWPFVHRILSLYLFWFVIQVPLFSLGGTRELISFHRNLTLLENIQKVLFSSTYSISWYLVALLWCGIITFYLSHFWKGISLAVAGMLYILSITNNGSNEFFQDTWIYSVGEAYKSVFYTIRWSFPYGLIFFLTGYYLKDMEQRIHWKYFAACIALYGVIYVMKYHFAAVNIVYQFSTPLLILGITGLILKGGHPQPYVEEGRILRNTSTLLYLSHPVIMAILYKLFDATGTTRLLETLLVFAPCCWLYFVLRQKRGFGWLKYAC